MKAVKLTLADWTYVIEAVQRRALELAREGQRTAAERMCQLDVIVREQVDDSAAERIALPEPEGL